MDYKAAYFSLFAEIANATECLEHKQYEKALSILILAQHNAEDKYINNADGIAIAFQKPKTSSKNKKKHKNEER